MHNQFPRASVLNSSHAVVRLDIFSYHSYFAAQNSGRIMDVAIVCLLSPWHMPVFIISDAAHERAMCGIMRLLNALTHYPWASPDADPPQD